MYTVRVLIIRAREISVYNVEYVQRKKKIKKKTIPGSIFGLLATYDW